MPDLLQKDETYAIIGAAMIVHNELGPGFLEAVYHEALAIEFTNQGIPFQRNVLLEIFYKKTKLNKSYEADFLCYGNTIVEIKALKDFNGDHESQLINYLKATGIEVGLLINFGKKSLQYKRLIFTQ